MDVKITWKFIYNKTKWTYSISFPMSTIYSFKSIENILDVYRGKDCMRKFSESLREVVNKRAAAAKWKCKNLLRL